MNPKTTGRIWASTTGIRFICHSGCTIEVPDRHLADLGYHKRSNHDTEQNIPGALNCEWCGYSMGIATDQGGVPRWVCDSYQCPNRGVMVPDTHKCRCEGCERSAKE